MSNCGPPPDASDFVNARGKLRARAYNRAYRRWLACTRRTLVTAERQQPENVAARQDTLSEIGSGLTDTLGNLAQGLLSSQGLYSPTGGPVDLRPAPQAAPPSPKPGSGLPDWALPAGAAAAALYLLTRK